MDCPNCGQYLDTSSSEEYVKCEYCKSKVAIVNYVLENARTLDDSNLTTDEKQKIQAMLKIANIDIENNNYESAYATCENIITSYPLIWQAYLYLAICNFWLGREDLNHLRQVVGFLDKAEKLSQNKALIKRTKADIAYNLALIAANKERIGTNIAWSLNTFVISKKLAEVHKSRDELIDEFTKIYFSELSEKLLSGLNRDKKDFDPQYSDLDSLFHLIILNNGKQKELNQTYLAYSHHKAKKHSEDSELKEKIKKIESFHSDNFKNIKIPSIHFSFFGRPLVA